MMTIKERQELVWKTAQWLERTDREVRKAGGCGVCAVLDFLNEDLLYTLVANDLYIHHVRKDSTTEKGDPR